MAEVLSDEQIDQLLVEAETRLASKGAPAKSVTRKENTALVPSSAAQSGKEPQKPVADKLSVRIPQLVAKKGKASQDDAGKDWFHMPQTKLTPELKKDLRVLRMRDVLDTKQFWRKDTRKDFIPKFSHVGTVVDGPLDAHSSSRLTKKEKKRTIVEEVLAEAKANTKFKTRYSDIQERKRSGKKAYYKKLVALRRGQP